MSSSNPRWCPKVLAPNRRELYTSFLAVVLWFVVALSTDDKQWQVVLLGLLLVALICALNALLDFNNMNAGEQICGAIWTPLLLFFVFSNFWMLFHPVRENRRAENARLKVELVSLVRPGANLT